jgi:hypothetical protein
MKAAAPAAARRAAQPKPQPAAAFLRRQKTDVPKRGSDVQSKPLLELPQRNLENTIRNEMAEMPGETPEMKICGLRAVLRCAEKRQDDLIRLYVTQARAKEVKELGELMKAYSLPLVPASMFIVILCRIISLKFMSFYSIVILYSIFPSISKMPQVCRQ